MARLSKLVDVGVWAHDFASKHPSYSLRLLLIFFPAILTFNVLFPWSFVLSSSRYWDTTEYNFECVIN